MTKQKQMRLAINDAELAIGSFSELADKMVGASDEVLVKVRLQDVRQLANCYPALNRIVNDPEFNLENLK